MRPPLTRIQKIFNAVQLTLLTVAGAMAAFGVFRAAERLRHALLGPGVDSWNMSGWYVLSTGGAGLGVLAVVLGFALVQWRRGGSYLAPIAFMLSVAAVDITFETYGMGIGKSLGAPDDVHYVIVHYWGQPATGLAIAALCLFGTWRLSWRTGAED